MTTPLGIIVKQIQSSLIEASAVDPDTFKVNRVVIDGETGETVTTNVPIGSAAWRKLARAARNYL